MWWNVGSGQTKNYKIGICCFSAKHAALRRKRKDWLARNQDNVSEWSHMSIRRLLFQWANTIKIQPYIVQRVFSYVQKLQSWWLLPYIIAFPIHWIDKSFSLQLLINFTFNYQSTNTIFHYCHCHMDLIFFVVIQQTCFFQSQMSNWKKFL